MRFLLAALIAAALLAAGCGGGSDEGDGGVKPETWASSVCTSLASWERDLKSGAAQLNGTLEKAAARKGLGGVRRELSDYLGRTAARTDDVLKDIDRAGTPAGKDGGAVRGVVHDGLVKMRQILGDAQRKARRLPVGDPKAFVREVTTLGEVIDRTATRTGNQLDRDLERRYGDTDIGKALNQEPACKSLSG
jgi:hypothetical protein